MSKERFLRHRDTDEENLEVLSSFGFNPHKELVHKFVEELFILANEVFEIKNNGNLILIEKYEIYKTIYIPMNFKFSTELFPKYKLSERFFIENNALIVQQLSRFLL